METLSQNTAAAALNLFQAHARLEERFAAGLGAVHGLSLKDALLLMHVARAEGGRLSRIDLAKRLSVSPSTVTRTTAPLEKLGFVARESHERDARYAFVVLTDAGRTAVANAEATFGRLAADTFRDRWTAAEIEKLGALLGRLA
ncbi:MAG: MarR family transcriptional regulator [Proteobacteria bacterium]|nr:MarR family transcriptional regulator [Pseudomonadota bacterium]MBS0548954.1 MarR family transcriptional regulator [Pseudomonadota bacterium]